MNTITFTCRVIYRYTRRSYHFLSPKLPLNVASNCGVKLVVVGLVPLIPIISAQDIIKSDKNEIPCKSEMESGSDVENNSEIADKSGWKGIKAIFETDEYGHLSKELTAILQSTSFALFVGLLFGGVKRSRSALHDFMDRNQASIFENHLDAKKRLQNHVTVHFGIGAFKWGCKLSIFTGGFLTFLMMMSAYRGHSSLVDFVFSGAVVGGILRIKFGPPSIIVGSLLGGVLGLFSGACTLMLLSYTGNSLDDVIACQYEIDRSRKNLFLEAEKKHLENKGFGNEGVAMIKTYESGKEKNEF